MTTPTKGLPQMPGFYPGKVIDNRDVTGMGRAKVAIVGLFPNGHPEWATPIGWPGAGGVGTGSQYPVEIGAQVAVFFEAGNIEAVPGYIPWMYGHTAHNQYAGPQSIKQIVDAGKNTNRRAVLWEDTYFTVAVQFDDVNLNDAETDHRVVITEKSTGSGITLNATDGADKTAVTLTISAFTGINIESNGLINIEADGGVQIQNRRVLRTKSTI